MDCRLLTGFVTRTEIATMPVPARGAYRMQTVELPMPNLIDTRKGEYYCSTCTHIVEMQTVCSICRAMPKMPRLCLKCLKCSKCSKCSKCRLLCSTFLYANMGVMLIGMAFSSVKCASTNLFSLLGTSVDKTVCLSLWISSAGL